MRRLRPEDLEPSEREKALARKSAEAGGYGGIGAGVGSVAGGVLGALIGGIPTAGAGALPGAGLGASLGGSAGGVIGGLLGESQANEADEELSKLDAERQRKILQQQLRQEALDALMAQS
jgi:hypothetical protein